MSVSDNDYEVQTIKFQLLLHVIGKRLSDNFPSLNLQPSVRQLNSLQEIEMYRFSIILAFFSLIISILVDRRMIYLTICLSELKHSTCLIALTSGFECRTNKKFWKL